MLSHVVIGTNDLDRAGEFYDAVLGEIGVQRMARMPRAIIYGKDGKLQVMVATPFNEEPATVGNGMMVALAADSEETVQRVYAKAIEMGGSDEGEPGTRLGGSFYAGYFRDRDGNKLNIYKRG